MQKPLDKKTSVQNAETIDRAKPSDDKNNADSIALAKIRDAIYGIQFGLVQISIQNGRVVQIDTTEKQRLV